MMCARAHNVQKGLVLSTSARFSADIKATAASKLADEGLLARIGIYSKNLNTKWNYDITSKLAVKPAEGKTTDENIGI